MAQSSRLALTQILKENHSCQICREICVGTRVLNCGHKFCSSCITNSHRVRPGCPVCNTQISYVLHLHSNDHLIKALMETLSPEEGDDSVSEWKRKYSLLNQTRSADEGRRVFEEASSDTRMHCLSLKELYSLCRYYNELQLISPPEWICATEARCCLRDPVILKMDRQTSSQHFTVASTTTGSLYFFGELRRVVPGTKKTGILTDARGNPVVNFEKASPFKYNIFPGGNSQGRLYKCKTRDFLYTNKLMAQFADRLTGQQRLVVVKCEGYRMISVIYLGEPNQGGIPVAKIYRPLHPSNKCYYLEIGAKVDIALVVTLCLALDEHSKFTRNIGMKLEH